LLQSIFYITSTLEGAVCTEQNADRISTLDIRAFSSLIHRLGDDHDHDVGDDHDHDAGDHDHEKVTAGG
jgi:hypothetical protein